MSSSILVQGLFSPDQGPAELSSCLVKKQPSGTSGGSSFTTEGTNSPCEEEGWEQPGVGACDEEHLGLVAAGHSDMSERIMGRRTTRLRTELNKHVAEERIEGARGCL